LPKGFAIGLVEGDNIFDAKKKIGDNVTLAGGMPLELMKLSTKEKCIDAAKRIIDECAPGGGYIFATSRALLSKGDVNVENLKAVNEFVHEYGVYK
jgi:uroporphyrinogen-III decarboxylase